jgi:hypothetical protein
MKKLAALILLPVLGGCINDGIAMRIDGPEHAISVLREQKLFWEKKVDLELVVARLPDCQRRHRIASAPIGGFKIEAYRTGPNTFLLQQGNNLYSVETQTCQKFEKLNAPPADGMGELVGAFREEKGALRFVATQAVPTAK